MNMVRRLLTRAVLPLLLLLAGAAPTPAQVDPLEELDAYIERAMEDWELPGLAIAIVKDDSVVFARGYGVRELGKSDPVDGHTLFAVASHTKAFTAAALGLLVQEGRLSWDDRVIGHMPKFRLYDPTATREMTIRDLLTHRAGYRTWAGDLLWWGSNLDRQEVLGRTRYLKPDYSFRSRYGYNNMMFVAAGELIPIVTDTSWDDFVTGRILQPLGMNRSTTTVRDLPERGNVASPHTRVDGKIVPITYRNIDNIGPAGSLNSSAIEMARWLRFQLAYGFWDGVQLVDSAIIRETRTTQTLIPMSTFIQREFPTTHFLAYGLGWFMQDYHGCLVLRHGGGMDGMFSYSIFLPEAGLGVTVLTNSDTQSLYAALAWYAVDDFLGRPEKDWSAIYLKRAREGEKREAKARKELEEQRAGKSKPSLPLKAYAGTYRNDYYGTATVGRERGELVLYMEAHPGVKGALEHWHYDTFISRWSDPMWGRSFVTFTLDADGKAATLSLKVREDFVDPLEYVFKRVP